MKLFARASALTAGTIAALLSGCSSPQPATGSGFDLIPHYAARTGHFDHGTSWMSPGAKAVKKLLYVSDWATNDVFVYDYKNGTLVGQLTGFNSPYGQCVDARGDVWITSFGDASIVEYAHGGSQPLKTLTTDQQPYGCSVDPTTGNLAVAGGSSSVDVFDRARGQKHTYQSHYCFPFWAPGYDNHGNLYVLGLLYGSARPLSGYSDPVPCELPHGSTALRPVHVHGLFVAYPGSIMWDGKHLTVTDQTYMGRDQTGIYRVKEDASGNLTAIGETVLSDDCDGTDVDVVQPFIVGEKNTPVNAQEGHVVVGGNLRCTSYGSGAKFDYWSYPAGGTPAFALPSPPQEPRGESVSISGS